MEKIQVPVLKNVNRQPVEKRPNKQKATSGFGGQSLLSGLRSSVLFFGSCGEEDSLNNPHYKLINGLIVLMGISSFNSLPPPNFHNLPASGQEWRRFKEEDWEDASGRHISSFSTAPV